MTGRPARRLVLLITLAATASLVACGGSTRPGSSGTAGGSTSLPGLEAAHEGDATSAVSRYGYGPQADPSVTYQPDVVLIDGGPEAIRSVSADGLVWRLDADAGGMDQLAAGKILFASSDGLGRVQAIESDGDEVTVTLAPVALTEVVRDAHIILDRPVELGSLELQDVPMPPDGFEDEASDELGGFLDRASGAAHVQLASYVAPAGAAAAPTSTGGELTKTVGDWTLTAYRGEGTLGLRAERGLVAGGLKIRLDAQIEAGDLHVIADVPIANGVVGNSQFEVSGITGLTLSIEGGAGNGLSDNRKVRMELPVQLSERVVIGGIPMTLTQKFRFLVQTAFTAKNGNLSASGSWSVDGPLGFDGTTLTTPTITERGTKLIDSLTGVSVGVNGVVVGVAFKFGLMAGLPVAGAGPYANFATSLGLTKGSSLGIVNCRQSTLTSLLTGGVGISVFEPVKKGLKALLGWEPPAQTDLLTATLIEETWYDPPVQACRP